jgi:hypothetical protein
MKNKVTKGKHLIDNKILCEFKQKYSIDQV